MDAEYITCSVVTQDAVWLKSFMHHLKIVKSMSNPITFYRDNCCSSCGKRFKIPWKDQTHQDEISLY